MKLADNTICTGCGACIKACSKNAITNIEDKEGFPTPQIDSNKCIECGLCNKICPVMHPLEKHPIKAAYAAQILDKEVLMESSSGAMFTAFSREILRRDGIVYGCVWDQKYNAVFDSAENEDALERMRGSKYVWSYAADVFPLIKKELTSGRVVLFTGLPCQIVGLRSYLQKDYDNLFLMDIFCNGTPSPLAFRKWLETISKPDEIAKLDLNFRDKSKFGVGVHFSYRGQKEKNNVHEFITNPYYYSFYKHIINRRCCYQCQLKDDKKNSDITIGDYWGIEKYHPDMDIKAGVSALLINSDKGADLLNSIKMNLDLRETDVSAIAERNNLNIGDTRKLRTIPDFRDGFFDQLKKRGWKSTERKYLMQKNRIFQLIRVKIPEPVIESIKRITKGST